MNWNFVIPLFILFLTYFYVAAAILFADPPEPFNPLRPTVLQLLTRYQLLWPHYRNTPTHGPQVWPWWRWVSVRVVRWEYYRTFTFQDYVGTKPAWNIWVYTRYGAWCFGWYQRGER